MVCRAPITIFSSSLRRSSGSRCPCTSLVMSENEDLLLSRTLFPIGLTGESAKKHSGRRCASCGMSQIYKNKWGGSYFWSIRGSIWNKGRSRGENHYISPFTCGFVVGCISGIAGLAVIAVWLAKKNFDEPLYARDRPSRIWPIRETYGSVWVSFCLWIVTDGSWLRVWWSTEFTFSS